MSLTFHANGLITGSKITMPEGSGCKGAVIQRVKVERGGNTGTADILSLIHISEPTRPY
mgnify:CR=1 FL=1